MPSSEELKPVAWQWRYKHNNPDAIWSKWSQHHETLSCDPDYIEESRPLYLHPAPTAADTLGWATVRVEDTGDGLIIHPDDAKEWRLKTDHQYSGYFLPDGRYRIALTPAPEQPAAADTGLVERLAEVERYWMDAIKIAADLDQQLAAAREQIAEERARGDRIAADWFDFCDMMGVQPDTQEAVASSLKASLSSAHETIRAMREALEGARGVVSGVVVDNGSDSAWAAKVLKTIDAALTLAAKEMPDGK